MQDLLKKTYSAKPESASIFLFETLSRTEDDLKTSCTSSIAVLGTAVYVFLPYITNPAAGTCSCIAFPFFDSTPAIAPNCALSVE
jgi:hypothetical protein